MRRRILAVALLSLGTALPAAALPRYTVTPLGAYGQVPTNSNGVVSVAYGINDLGNVVGCWGILGQDGAQDQSEGFIYFQATAPDTPESIGFGPLEGGQGSGVNTCGLGINHDNLVVGSSYTPTGTQAFRYQYDPITQTGTMTGLGYLDGSFSEAAAINDGGLIVGTASVAGAGVPFTYSQSGGLQRFGSVAGNALAVNNAGTVVGATGLNAFAGIDADGNLVTLERIWGTECSALAINNANPPQIVGKCSQNPVLWTGVGVAPIILSDHYLLARWESIAAHGITDDGLIVGTKYSFNFPNTAVILANGTATDLSTLVDGPRWNLISARAVNNSRWIAAFGYNPTGGLEACLLKPVDDGSTPFISTSAAAVRFVQQKVGDPLGGQHTLLISNLAGGTLDWTVASDAAWLTSSPASGTSAGAVTLAVDTAALYSGSTQTSLTISSNTASNGPIILPVTITLPAISLTYPVGGETLTGGQSTTIRWQVNPTRNAATTSVSYSLYGDGNWKLIKSLKGIATSAPWRVPSVKALTSVAQVKVELKDARGAVVGSGFSGNFSIEK